MASNKKGSHAGTDHLFGSYWKHLRKKGKQQFWKKERHLTELSIKKGEDNEKAGFIVYPSLPPTGAGRIGKKCRDEPDRRESGVKPRDRSEEMVHELQRIFCKGRYYSWTVRQGK